MSILCSIFRGSLLDIFCSTGLFQLKFYRKDFAIFSDYLEAFAPALLDVALHILRSRSETKYLIINYLPQYSRSFNNNTTNISRHLIKHGRFSLLILTNNILPYWKITSNLIRTKCSSQWAYCFRYCSHGRSSNSNG
jgi:hypothetical protein